MSTVIYVSNQQIQVAVGRLNSRKIVIDQSYTEDAPEGSIINGMIMDPELFIGFMKEFWASHKLPVKDVILVINTSKFVGKMIELPSLNVKKTFEFISREFADINRSENSLFGYLTLTDEKGSLRKIYAEGIDKDFIKDYLDIFGEIGIHISSIYSGEGSLIGLTRMTLGKKYRTFSLLVAESNILTTILWIDGNFYYFNSTRSFYEQGTEEYAQDAARSVSQLVQFMQAHQIEQKMESIFLAGIERSDLSMYQKAIGQMRIDTPVDLFESSSLKASGAADIQKNLRPASGLAVIEKNADFLKQYTQEKGKKSETGTEEGINWLPVLITFAAVAVIFLISLVLFFIKKAELKQLDAYNESPEVITGVAEYDMQKSRNSYLNAQYQAILDVDENIRTYPLGDSEILNQIKTCAAGYATVTFDAFDATEGTIQMTASSDTVDNINCFIAELNRQDIFNNIDYTGYEYNDSTQNWDIHVTCILAEAAGR